MISQNLKQFKEINNLSFRELSRQLKISHVVLIKIINKKREKVRMDSICRVAEGLNVKIDDLLFTDIYSN
ncbi:MAG: helix-turn-helix transcriptional regulator [Peptostreptococcaceae bacterium]